MKNRLRAILLAAGLTVSLLSTGAVAQDATEAVSDASTEAVTEAPETEAGQATEAAAEDSSEAAGMEADAAGGEAADTTSSGGKYSSYYDNLKEGVKQTLQALSTMSDEQLEQLIANGQNASEVAMAAKWQSVKDELGNFVEVTEQEVSEENQVITIANTVVYDGVDENTPVKVDCLYDMSNGSVSLEWSIKYPMSKLMEQAALNTLMGLGIVFLVLLFLSIVIGQLHWIPDLIEGKNKAKEAPKAAAPAPAPVSAPAVEEEDLSDDLELVAVISAAIAASENAPADGFVVRTIKKANRRKWQNA